MSNEIQKKLCQFGWTLEQSIAFANSAIESDEISFELAARGVSRKELKEVREAMGKITRAFYDRAQPH